jgi:hypothetical protein
LRDGGFLELVTLKTSLRKQNHHQFKKADDAPQKYIKLPALLQRENKPKLLYALAKFLVKYNTSVAGVLSSDMVV